MRLENIRRLAYRLLFAFVMGSLSNGPARASVHTWTGAASGLWSNPTNWSGGVPSGVELPPIQVVFPVLQAPAVLNITNDLPLVDGDQFIIQGSGYTFNAIGNATNLNLKNNGYISVTGSNNVFGASVSLGLDGTNVLIHTAPGTSFTVKGSMQGLNGYTKSGMGELILTGPQLNYFIGATYVQAGTLTLNKDNGVTAIPGTLQIGSNVSSNTALVKALTTGQIENDIQLEVYDNGTLDLNGNSASVGTVLLNGGVITTGSGTLTLGGSVTVNFSTLGNSFITGKLSLGSFTRNFNINSGLLDLSADVVGSGGIRSPGITKYGNGLLVLRGDNSFPGLTTIIQGTLEVASAYALGATNNGTIVTNGAALRLTGINITDEPISLEGTGTGGGFNNGALQFDKTNTWTGPMTLTGNTTLYGISASAKLNLTGVIDGIGGFTFTNGGTLVLSGEDPNVFGGTTIVAAGKLLLSKSIFGFGVVSVPGALIIGQASGTPATDVVQLLTSHQIANAAQVTVRHTGQFDLNGNTDTVGHVVLEDGKVSTGTGQLTMNGNIFVPVSGTFLNSIHGKLALNGNRVINTSAGATLQVLAEISDGGVTSDLTFSGAGTANLSSSNSFSGTIYVGQGRVTINHTNALGSTNAGTVVNGGEIVFGNLTNISESLDLSGFGNGMGALQFSGTNVLNGPVTFSGDAGLAALSPSSHITFNGVLSGGGNVFATNGGTFVFAGGQPNTLTGTTFLSGNATLRLNKIAGGLGTNAVGSLAIGNNSTNIDLVLLQANNQITSNASMAAYKSGQLDLQNFSCQVASVSLSNTIIKGTTGQLALTGGISANANCSIQVKMRLEPSTTISVINGFLSLSAEVKDGSGAAGLIKVGNGTLSLFSSNSFTGPIAVTDGSLVANHTFALGSTNAGTTIMSGGALTLANVLGSMESISLNGPGNSFDKTLTVNSPGTNVLSGNITLVTDVIVGINGTNHALYLDGMIIGSGGLKKVGLGTLRLGGSSNNNYAGATIVGDGTLELGKTNALAVPSMLILSNNVASTPAVRLLRDHQMEDNASVTLNSTGTLDLNNCNDTVGSITGSGSIKIGVGVLTTGGNNATTTFSGLISGSGNPLQPQFVKTGLGTLTLTGNNTYTGDTLVLGGKLIIDGLQVGPVDVFSPSILGGKGQVGAIGSSGGTISPGSSLGQLTSGNLNFNSNSTLLIEINGTATSNYDQVCVLGTVNLNGAILPVVNFNSAISNQFIVIQNDGNEAINGTFSNLPEGSILTVGNRQFQISYVGGDGNDVVLKQISNGAEPKFGSIARLPNGHSLLQGTGLANASYSVEASTNLMVWDSIATIAADSGGALQFEDTNAVLFPYRFYRLLAP